MFIQVADAAILLDEGVKCDSTSLQINKALCCFNSLGGRRRACFLYRRQQKSHHQHFYIFLCEHEMQNTNIMTHVAISVRNNHNMILFFCSPNAQDAAKSLSLMSGKLHLTELLAFKSSKQRQRAALQGGLFMNNNHWHVCIPNGQ